MITFHSPAKVKTKTKGMREKREIKRHQWENGFAGHINFPLTNQKMDWIQHTVWSKLFCRNTRNKSLHWSMFLIIKCRAIGSLFGICQYEWNLYLPWNRKSIFTAIQSSTEGANDLNAAKRGKLQSMREVILFHSLPLPLFPVLSISLHICPTFTIFLFSFSIQHFSYCFYLLLLSALLHLCLTIWNILDK